MPRFIYYIVNIKFFHIFNFCTWKNISPIAASWWLNILTILTIVIKRKMNYCSEQNGRKEAKSDRDTEVA